MVSSLPARRPKIEGQLVENTRTRRRKEKGFCDAFAKSTKKTKKTSDHDEDEGRQHRLPPIYPPSISCCGTNLIFACLISDAIGLSRKVSLSRDTRKHEGPDSESSVKFSRHMNTGVAAAGALMAGLVCWKSLHEGGGGKEGNVNVCWGWSYGNMGFFLRITG